MEKIKQDLEWGVNIEDQPLNAISDKLDSDAGVNSDTLFGIAGEYVNNKVKFIDATNEAVSLLSDVMEDGQAQRLDAAKTAL